MEFDTNDMYCGHVINTSSPLPSPLTIVHRSLRAIHGCSSSPVHWSHAAVGRSGAAHHWCLRTKGSWGLSPLGGGFSSPLVLTKWSEGDYVHIWDNTDTWTCFLWAMTTAATLTLCGVTVALQVPQPVSDIPIAANPHHTTDSSSINLSSCSSLSSPDHCHPVDVH